MALMMYMSDERIEAGRKCAYPDVNRMLQDLRRRTGDDWFVDISVTTTKRWFRQTEDHIEYRLCHNTGHGEVQVLTSLNYAFFHMTGDLRLLARISKELVLDFINGYLIALDNEREDT